MIFASDQVCLLTEMLASLQVARKGKIVLVENIESKVSSQELRIVCGK
jgi:hypothetical protein